MSEPRRYSTTDVSSRTDTRNLGFSRVRTIGTCIHSTSGIDSLDWLVSGAAQSGNPATVDCLIARNGERYTFVPGGRYPYAAGQSRLIYNNRLYVGDELSQLLYHVELENQDSTLVTFAQIDSLAELIVSDPLRQGWQWPYYLVGHYEIATPVGRRSDPLGLDWGSLMGRIYYRAAVAGVAGLIPVQSAFNT